MAGKKPALEPTQEQYLQVLDRITILWGEAQEIIATSRCTNPVSVEAGNVVPGRKLMWVRCTSGFRLCVGDQYGHKPMQEASMQQKIDLIPFLDDLFKEVAVMRNKTYRDAVSALSTMQVVVERARQALGSEVA